MIIEKLIGNTPIIKLSSINDTNCNIYVKLEYYNLGGSIKSRVAYELIKDAKESGILSPNCTLIEATGGNTGLAMSIICNNYGYKFIAVVPDNYSAERIQLLKLYGANVVLSNHHLGNNSHIIKKDEMLDREPNYICLDQFNNISSIKAHYNNTGKEILEEINKVDAFVSGVGSAGTFMGISQRLKYTSNHTKCYIVQPKGCDIIQGKSISHEIQGISVGIIPPLLDISISDGCIDVEINEVKRLLHQLCVVEGLFLGISSGANILAALKLAKTLKKGNIVTVAPDAGNYYMDFYIRK